MGSQLDQIVQWAIPTLKPWELCALDRIMAGGELADADVDQLVQHFMEDAGLMEPQGQRAALSFQCETDGREQTKAVRLERIFAVQDVNALTRDQSLPFGPQLTLIYGDNGAGKSGYARVLGSAASGRGKRNVLPNAASAVTHAPPRASIEIRCGEEKSVVAWTAGSQCEQLANFFVFDDVSRVTHLSDENAFTFIPGDLWVLTRLAEVTDRVRARVRERIAAQDIECTFDGLFDARSRLRDLVSGDNLRTNIENLRRLATLSESDREDIGRLEREVAELRALDVTAQHNHKVTELADLKSLELSIDSALRGLGETSELHVSELIDEFVNFQKAAESSGASQFAFPGFSAVGSRQWTEFITAARALAEAESKGRANYPADGDHCLLCRQPLQIGAARTLMAYWDFLGSDSRQRLNAAAEACEVTGREIQGVGVDYFNEGSAVRRIVERDAPTLVSQIAAQAEAFAERKTRLQLALQSHEKVTLPPLVVPSLADLERLIQVRHGEIDELGRLDVSEKLAASEKSLHEFEDRDLLSKILPEIEIHLARKEWCQRARESLGSTKAITTKYRELYHELVTERYVKAFKEILSTFKKGIGVTVATKGSKGETVRQIVLNPETFKAAVPIDRVLSEGEKTAVALADFFAEAFVTDRCDGVVFDDPVTSMDGRSIETLAETLAKLAAKTQVIVFTHNLGFLYRIVAHATTGEVDVVSHWIREENGYPGFVYAGNSPVTEGHFKNAEIARKHYVAAKNLPPEEQQRELQQGFGALRACYEALVIFEVFGGVVDRFNERLSFDRLRHVRVEHSIVLEIIERMGYLSRFIVAHLHSDEYAIEKPTVEDLFKEIQAFEGIKKKQQKLKNQEPVKSGNLTSDAGSTSALN